MRAINQFLTVSILAVCAGGCSSGSSPEDTTPPIITLLGDNPQTLEVGDPYVEAGATATDNVDGDLSAAIVIDASNVDTSVPGEYTVTYNVSDAAGNRAATVTRRVLCEDTTPPVITLIGDNPQSIWQGDAYTELGATASDNVDGDITSAIVIDTTGVDVSTAGEYTITYDVSDAAGNAAATATRTVRVEVPILSANARLADLTISAGNFDQIFQSSQPDYTATVSLLTSTTTVTATTEDPNATLNVNGTDVLSATESGKVTLNVGNTDITVMVTAEDGVATETYMIDVTRQSAASFAQQAYIKASNAESDDPSFRDVGGDRFATSVALFGDTIAVSAMEEDSAATGINGDQSDNSALEAGAVYVFVRDDAGVWSQKAYIKASNTDDSDRFGRSIDLSGDTLAVGAIWEESAATGINGDQLDNSTPNAGAVYVFTRDAAGSWSQQAYIKASDTARSQQFGNNVSLSGDSLAVVGKLRVYVFTRDSAGDWSEQTQIESPNNVDTNRFGHSIDLEGDTLAVGAYTDDSGATGIDGDQYDTSAPGSGAVYVFTRNAAGIWSEQAYIKASNTDGDDRFGRQVALSGNTLAVGAPGEDSAATGVDGDQSDNSVASAGAVYIFVRDDAGAWSQQAYIKASITDVGDVFSAVALTGDTLAVGAGDDSAATGINGDQHDNSARDSGAAYLFTRDAAGTWSQQAYIKASNTDAFDRFSSRAVTADTLVGGAIFERSLATGIDGDQSDNSGAEVGAVYVFQ